MTPSLTRSTSIPVRLSSLAPWVDAGVFGPAEVHAAEVLTRSDPGTGPLLQLAAACALWAPLHGHSCVDVERVASMVAAELAADSVRDGAASVVGPPGESGSTHAPEHGAVSLPWPAPRTWIGALEASVLVRSVAAHDREVVLDERPLVLHGSLLYTQRQWIDECTVAEHLARRATAVTATGLPDAAGGALSADAASLLDRLLPELDPDGSPNLQRSAALTMLTSSVAVVVGGPGTGKTHTIARMLAVASTDAEAQGRALRIGLAAPTGKAAARMHEAISAAAAAGITGGHLTTAQAAHIEAIPTSTIHRMLGWNGSTTRFHHDADTPLPFDVVIVDEASMVALPLMARLMEAVAPTSRLVLVGDPDQLHSIEVGAVLADIVAAASDAGSPLHDCVIRLQRPRRQQAGSPIALLAEAVRDNRPQDAIALARGDSGDGSRAAPLTFVETTDPLAKDPSASVRDAVLAPLAAAAQAAVSGDAERALRHFASVRVLCAHRAGRHGVDMWNRTVEQWVLEATQPDGVHRPSRYYAGRPLLATRNDRRQRVANGDTGIVIADPGGVRAAFGTADGLRVLAPAQLERVETAFATTIHKSQGSEYATVVIVLPPATSPLVGRELLYTAVTRATERLLIVGSEAAFAACVETPVRRVSGLTAALARSRGR